MRKLIFLIMILALSLSFCGKKSNESAQVKKEEAIPVYVAKVSEQTIRATILITGEVAPRYKVTVFPRANGLVVKEFVKSGEQVKKDQVLAEVKQDIPGMEYANVKINATVSGIITRDAVDVGDRVSMQTPAYEISRLDPVDVRLNVPEKYLSEIKHGMSMSLMLDAFSGETFQGKIREISPVVDSRSRMLPVKVALKNGDHRLRPGMFARAKLATGSRTGLVVPLDAVVKSGVERFVFVVENNRARLVKVATGEFLDSMVEVTGDLKTDDLVVVMGQNMLSDGTLVKIIEEK
ncbi:MAG: efflux RND transporter periplasmic adaptor subunit [Calditrichaeota bacterium]|nr:efflux RND transporter periplasmic adaptor subunit [Calditrichota bacterium]